MAIFIYRFSIIYCCFSTQSSVRSEPERPRFDSAAGVIAVYVGAAQTLHTQHMNEGLHETEAQLRIVLHVKRPANRPQAAKRERLEHIIGPDKEGVSNADQSGR